MDIPVVLHYMYIFSLPVGRRGQQLQKKIGRFKKSEEYYYTEEREGSLGSECSKTGHEKVITLQWLCTWYKLPQNKKDI